MENFPLLDVVNLSIGLNSEKGYLKAIKDINFSIDPGETLVLLGESGSGKTMTALAVNQLLPPVAHYGTQSRILFEDSDLLLFSEVKMREYRGRKISMIFQDPMSSLNPVYTVGQQIEESYKRHTHLTAKERKTKAIELLDAVGIPSPKERYRDYPHQLSGGMKQRVMIAMALTQHPQLLIADEATTALDVTIQYQVLQLLKKLQQETKMSILFITHDLGVAAEIADKIAVMYNGHIIEVASKDDFFNNPLHPYSRRLFDVLPNIHKRDQQLQAITGIVPPITEKLVGCPFASRCCQVWALCRKEFPTIKKIGTQEVACHLYSTDHEPVVSKKQIIRFDNAVMDNENIVSVDNLKVFYPIRAGILQRKVADVKAVDGVTFQLEKGKTLALVGESGCGKSTLGKALLQLIDSTEGQVFYRGENVFDQKNSRQFRRDIQIIFQDPYSSLNPRKTVFQSISEGMIIHRMLSASHLVEEVDKLLNAVGIAADYKYRYPHEFSGGQRQRICIARALAVQPKVIVCDEPTSGLDVSIQAQILNLLKNLQANYEISFLFITHDISVVSYIADEIAVMYLGKIVEQGSVHEILEDPKHPYTQTLLSAVLEVKKSKEKPVELKGEQPSPINPPSGCYFHPRCPHVMKSCKEIYPKLSKIGKKRTISCYLYS